MLCKCKDLEQILSKEENTMEYLMQNKILVYKDECSECKSPLRKLSTSTFRCTKWSCYKFYSLFKYTIFSNTKIQLNDFLKVAYYWLAKCSFISIQIITGIQPAQ
ncbi:hypothetical protein H312_00810 [Anncaliia algerae PRA339]|uniref:Uncharacterized protein n=1 Tax=Anncaliia algerae PRA339 TaxID=1288291 RepID=A0A059F3I6_9MICR|nr:hypothetical protein H312_00810 [Anncaliia algerae PRA339]